MAWAPDYLTVDELADWVRVADSIDDVALALAITAASRAIDGYCNRQFGKVAAPEERTYVAAPRFDRGRWAVDIDDVMSTTGMTVAVSGGAVTAYTLEPRNAAAEGRPWTRLVFDVDAPLVPLHTDRDVTLVAPWGWSAVPSTVKLACALQASRFQSRRDSPYGVAGSPDMGNELRLLARLDPDVQTSLTPYRRPRKVA